MDGPFYVDTRSPHISTDVASVTLAATNKALVPIANLPILGSNYFSYVGKAVRMRLYGRITTGATPGNMQAAILWGNGADANGTVIAQTAAVALTATQTSLTWEWDIFVRCRTLGGAGVGSLIAHGMFNANVAVLASTLQPVMMPASAPAAVLVDLTVANVLSPQFLRSGSTAEAMQVHEFLFEALN
jgi:hypothetical protein